MFPLSDKGLPPSNVQNIIFVTRPKLHLMEQISQNLLQWVSFIMTTYIHLFSVPLNQRADILLIIIIMSICPQ